MAILTHKSYIFTDRVRSTTGRLCFNTCLSINLSVNTWGGGTRARSRWWGGGVPKPGPGGGTPPWVHPRQTWTGGMLMGVPHLRYPPSDLDGGTLMGGYPTLGTPPSDLDGGYPDGGYPTSGIPPSDLDGGYPNGAEGTPLWLTDGVLDKRRWVCLLRSRRRTFLCIDVKKCFCLFYRV